MEELTISNCTTYPSNLLVLEDAPSPELFESDTEDETISNITYSTSGTSINASQVKPSPKKLSQEELVRLSDNCLLSRIQKYVSGIPPPPKHTICQLGCNDMLTKIDKNRLYFSKNAHNFQKVSSVIFEASDQSNDSAYLDNESTTTDVCDESSTIFSNDEQSKDSAILMESNNSVIDSFSSQNLTKSVFDKSKNSSSSDLDESALLLYRSIPPNEATSLQWPEAFLHKSFGIHYNRSKAVENFEGISLKMCERYITAETQSTCNIWFTKQSASPKPKSLLSRYNGQSPGKRLSYLAKRRRTFSSANLVGLNLLDKRQIMMKKPIMKIGKSPRGKSPRGKSPRGKSPRSSTKKRAIRRLTLDGLSPHKSKLEISKRALFQSPPGNRAGSSKMLTTNDMSSEKIKRALFPTPNKNEDSSSNSRKRKNEEPLENTNFKWAKKSLSFDCPRDVSNSSTNCNKQSTGNGLSRNHSTATCDKRDLSDSHRKKLLWAVAEALRAKGIGMGHPRFKQYATSLIQTVKKYMPDLENRDIPRKPGSTSDRMLKLAKHHVLLLVDVKSAH